MNAIIYENGAQIGVCETQCEGLYRKFSCKLEKTMEQPRRIYVLSGHDSEYLGVADRSGLLTARLPEKRLAHGVDGFVAAAAPRCDWQPWRGALDGVAVEGVFLRRRPDGFDAALPPAQAVRFPEWVEQFHREVLFGAEYACIALNADGQLPLIQKEDGGLEKDETNGLLTAGTDLPADDFADDGLGEQGGQADCPDL